MVAEFASYGGYVLGTTAFQMAPVGEITLLLSTSPYLLSLTSILWAYALNEVRGLECY